MLELSKIKSIADSSCLENFAGNTAAMRFWVFIGEIDVIETPI